MADNVTLPAQGTGDTTPVVATDDVAGAHYQYMKLVDGTADSTAKIAGDASNGLDVDVTRVGGNVSVIGSTGVPVRVQDDPMFDLTGQSTPGSIVFKEPGDTPVLGMWNDAAGSASLDWEVPLFGQPSIRLDPQGNTAAGSDPGTSPLTGGVVFKRRLQFLVAGIYSVEMWLRWTSTNLSTNTKTTISLYNRDGTNFYMSRLWLNNTVNPLSLKYLNSSGTYTEKATVNLVPATHLYDLPSGKLDKAGMWSYARLVTNFNTLKYIGFQFNDVWYDLAGVSIYQTASVAAQAMHFGVEFSGTTSTRPRYIHVAQVIGRRYG